MTVELTRRLLEGGLIAPKDIELALLHSAVKDVPLVSILLDGKEDVAAVVERELGHATALSVGTVVPMSQLYDRLPEGLSDRLLAVPIRQDPITMTADIAAVDPFDQHLVHELSFHLGVPVRMVRAPLAAVRAALGTLRVERNSRPPPDGTSQAPLPLVNKLARKASADLDQVEDDVVLDLTRAKPHGRVGQIRGHGVDLESVQKQLQAAETAADVAELCAVHACPEGSSLVFAVKKHEFVALATSFEVSSLSDLALARDRPTILKTAVESGNYLGPIPETLVHALLRDLLTTRIGNEVYAVPASVNSRPTLVILSTGFERAFTATRHADQVAAAAALALERIVKKKKQRS